MSKRHSKSNSSRSGGHGGGHGRGQSGVGGGGGANNSNQSNKNTKKHAQGHQGQVGGGGGVNAGGKGSDPAQFNGVYLNKSMTHALTSLVGAKVVVRVKNEDNVYEGFFHCFSQNMDLVVSGVHKVSKNISEIFSTLFSRSNFKKLKKKFQPFFS